MLTSAMALLAALAAAPAIAGEAMTAAEAAALLAPEDLVQPMSAEEVAALLAAPSEPLESEALDASDLNGISGGSDVHAGILSTQELNATNSDNVIEGSVYSGDVVFADDALSGFAGVGNFVINTGAQNNLQGSITINILTAAP